MLNRQDLDILEDLARNNDDVIILDYISESKKAYSLGRVAKFVEKDGVLQISVRDEDSLTLFKEIIKINEKITLFLKRRCISFICKFDKKKYEGGLTFEVQLPEDINFHDRRKSKRSILARPCVVVLDLDSKVITKNCYDLGVGGLSLLFSKSENISFKDGQILNSCSIKISSGKIKGLKLRYLRTVQLAPYQYENYPFGGKRVSFSFHELSSSDLSKIEVFMEENDAFKIT